LALAGLGLWLFYKRNIIGIGILFYLGCLFPYLNIIAPAPGIFAERMAYFPSLENSYWSSGTLYRIIVLQIF